jgi:pimeloyl-ACP methyl ester carboxylesterase
VRRSAAGPVAAVVVLALVVGLGAAIGVAVTRVGDHRDGTAVTVPTTTPRPGATRPPRPALARFYGQRLSWSSCRDGDLCARLTVPLDYAAPGGPTIRLAVLKVPAADPGRRIASLVVNPGGPGASGTDYAANAAQVFREPVRQVYDVVGFDPRGTGASDPVDCLGDDELDQYVAEDPDPDTPAEVATYAGFVHALGAGCRERSGQLAAHISTVEAARDLDVLRAALGESRLDYFGASYGTKLGATYADLFPSRVGRMVLDGAVDPELPSRELSLQQAAGFETALRSYVADCVAGGDGGDGCFLGDSVDAGLARIRALLDQVDQQPLPAADGRELRVGNAFYGVVLPLYNRDYWPILSQALEAAFAGHGDLLLRLSDLYNSRGPSGYTDNSVEANYAINCLDDPWSVPPAQVPAAYPDFERASPTFGRVFAWGLATCGGAEVTSPDHDRTIRAAGAPPIVVVGTTRDPATPYAWAVSLAHELRSGVLVSRDGDGHTGYNAGNGCVDRAVESFLDDGTVPRDGLSC